MTNHPHEDGLPVATIAHALTARAERLRVLAHSNVLPPPLTVATPGLAELVSRGRAVLLVDAETLDAIAATALADAARVRLRDPWVLAALRAHAQDLRARAAEHAAQLPAPGNVWCTGPELAALVERGRQAMERDAEDVEAAAAMLEADVSAS